MSSDEPNELSPRWSFLNIDLGDTWCWTKMTPTVEKDVLTKLGQFERMTWTELQQLGCHTVEVDDLTKTAQRRLLEIGQDDVPSLYSLRFTGKTRIWAIKDGNVLKLLWADPNHEICPSFKKHT